jgi:hypothetical protein
MADGPVWFSGISDTVLAKVAFWYENWHRGDEFATRDRINDTGTAVEQVVTKRLHAIQWTKAEFANLVAIMKRVRPKSALTADLDVVLSGFDKNRLNLYGTRNIRIATYLDDVKELYNAVVEAKSGTNGIDVSAGRTPGKGIWE